MEVRRAYLPWQRPFNCPSALKLRCKVTSTRFSGRYGALSTLHTKLQDSVHERGRRGGDVERLDVAAHRQGPGLVAGGPHARAQALPLRPENHHDAAAVIRLRVRYAGRIGAVDPGVR